MEGNFTAGHFLIEPQTNRLYADQGAGACHSLEPKSMQVLLCLASSAPNVVSKTELIDQVWGNMVVGDDVLTNAIWQIRSALSDSARRPKYIETIRGKGYRLMHVPRPVATLSQPSDNKPSDALSPTPSPYPQRSTFGSSIAPMAMLLGITLLGATVLLTKKPDAALEATSTQSTNALATHSFAQLEPAKQSAAEHVEQARRLLDQANNEHMIARAKQHALVAQELDASSAEADHILGEIYTLHEWNWCGAQQVMHRVLNINPSSQAYAHHAWLMTVLGKHEDAKVSLARSRSAEDLNLQTGLLGLRIDALMQRYDEVERNAHELLKLHPEEKKIIKQLELMMIERAQTTEEIDAVKEKHARNKYAGKIAYIDATFGRRTEQVETILKQLENENGSPYQIAMIHAALGNHDAAVEQLKKGIDLHYVAMPRINVDPRFLRNKPEFQTLLETMNLKDLDCRVESRLAADAH